MKYLKTIYPILRIIYDFLKNLLYKYELFLKIFINYSKKFDFILFIFLSVQYLKIFYSQNCCFLNQKLIKKKKYKKINYLVYFLVLFNHQLTFN